MQTSVSKLLAALPPGTLLAALPPGTLLVAAVTPEGLAAVTPEGLAAMTTNVSASQPSTSKSLDPAKVANSLDPDETAKLGRLVHALSKPLNEPRAIILKLLKATAVGEWLSFPKMTEAIEGAGAANDTHEASERGAAALREFSWQIKQYMHPTDLIGHKSPIEVFATRIRVGKETRYRLTKIGRAAVASIV